MVRMLAPNICDPEFAWGLRLHGMRVETEEVAEKGVRHGKVRTSV